MTGNLVTKRIDGAELRYLKESDADEYDPACIKGIVQTIDAMMENLESESEQQK